MAAHKCRVMHRSLRQTPPKAFGGEGVWLFAEDGRKILDSSGGAAVSCLGHQHPRVIEAIKKQSSKLAYAHTAFFSSEPAEELAEKLVGHEPGGLAYVYFVSGGSEAVEASIKLARQYFVEIGEPQRQRFIARRQSYHGNTLGALAAGGNAWRREPYAPLLSQAFRRRRLPITRNATMNRKRISLRVWRRNWKPNSSGSAPTRSRPSSPSPSSAPRQAACRRLTATSRPSGKSVTGTVRC